MLLKVTPSLLLSPLLLQLGQFLRFHTRLHALPLLNLRFLVVVLVFFRVLITREVTNKEGPRLLFGLLFRPLYDSLSLLFLRLVPLDILPILVALEVLRLFLARWVVRYVTLSPHAYQEIFPVFDDHYDKNDELDCTDGR